MGDAEDLPAKIAKWLADSGRDLELHAARAARAAGALTAQSVPYVDRDTGKDREADVLAEFDGRSGAGIPVTVLAECKKALGKHWVAFPNDGGQISIQPIQHHAMVEPKEFIRIRRLEQAWQTADTIFGPEPAIAAALVDADIGKGAGERDKDANSLDTASRALRQCLSAARGLVSDVHETLPISKIIIPVVVSNAQLWTCRLTDDNQIETAAADYVRVRAPGAGGVLIHVMGLPRFQRFVRQVAELQNRSRHPDSP